MATDIIEQGFLDLSEDVVIREVRAKIESGVPTEHILRECQNGITAVGDAFGEGRMFVSDLVLSASIFRKVVNILMPDQNMKVFSGHKGKVVIGTVKEDLHNIGKDLIFNLLKVNGYDVIDIGVDCAPEDFVKAVRRSGAKVVALSCLLTSSYPFVIKTIEALKESGLRRRVKIIIGGAPLDEKAADYCGADAYGANARSVVSFAEKIYQRLYQ